MSFFWYQRRLLIHPLRTSGKRCLVYFSERGIAPSDINSEQLNRVREYRDRLQRDQGGLTGTFKDLFHFQSRLLRDLTKAIDEISLEYPHSLVGTGRESISNLADQTQLGVKVNSSTHQQNNRKYGKRRVQDVLERGSTRRIDLIVDGALYIAHPRYDYKKELMQQIMGHRPIPTKYLYLTESGCKRWLEACQTKNYTFYTDSVKNLNNKISEFISTAIDAQEGDCEFDFISLGSGNGDKDAIILQEMCKKLKEEDRIYFYPIDISDPMIVEAVRNSLQNVEIREKVFVKAIVGDITNLKPLEFIYEERPSRNFFSILGNTIGNTSELEIIDSLNEALLPGDFIFIEINSNQKSLDLKDNFYKNDISLKRHLVPLESLGINIDTNLIRYNIVENDSIFQNTKTLKVSYEKAKINGIDIDNIRLASIHHYDFNSFEEEINRRLRTKTIHKSEENGVGLILVQRDFR